MILMVTCAIREGAEDKVWSRLEFFKSLKKRRQGRMATPVTIGILGKTRRVNIMSNIHF